MQVTNSAKHMVAISLSVMLVLQGLIPSPSAFAETVANASSTQSNHMVAKGIAADVADDSNGASATADGKEPAESAAEEEAPEAGQPSAGADVDIVETTEAATDEGAVAEVESAEPVLASAAPAITSAKELQDIINDNNYGTVSLSSDGLSVISIEATAKEALKVISNANPDIYQNAAISINVTGDTVVDLCGGEDGYSFLGFGSEDVKFEGSFTLNGRLLKINRTLFNGIKLTDSNNNLSVQWAGETSNADPIIASSIDGGGKTLDAAVQLVDPSSGADVSSTSPALTSALLGVTEGDLGVSATYSFPNSGSTRRGVAISSAAGNAGLIANTVKSGKLKIENISLPADDIVGAPTVTATKNAGGLIGAVGIDDTGAVTNGAEIDIATGVDVSDFSVSGNDAAGGLIGKANDLTLTLPSGNGFAASVKPAMAVGNSNACIYAGGLIGYVAFAGKQTIDGSVIDFGNGEGVSLSVNDTSGAKPRAGGLFGALDMSKGDVSIQGGSLKSSLTYGKDDNGNGEKRGSYGGLVGLLWGAKADDGALRALTVSNSASIEFGFASNDKLHYAGGVVGYEGEGGGSANTVALILDGVSVLCKSEGATFSLNCKFGGAVGVLDTNNVLDARNVAVKTADGIEIGGGNGGSAGIVGSSWQGIIKFGGITDLSEAKFKENDKAAQLVYENFNSLIFAAGSGGDSVSEENLSLGWKYIRPNAAVQLDDIFSYGQVIRLGGEKLPTSFITLNDTKHTWAIDGGSKLAKNNGAYTLSNVQDFAKLAITWQTSGCFSAVQGVSDNSSFKNNVPSSTIKISGTIDLSGTGLTGLTKDRAPQSPAGVDENAHVFKGSIEGDGANAEIDLAVGERYGWRGEAAITATDESAGNGMVYRHGRLGLFMGVNGAKVKNLTIGGTMHFSYMSEVDAGAFAADSSGSVETSNSVFNASMTFDGSACGGKVAHVGGIIGTVAKDSVAFNEDTSVQGSITSSEKKDGDKSAWGDSMVGGAIGYVAERKVTRDSNSRRITSVNSTVQIDANGLSISAAITNNGAESNSAFGGFIGVIKEGGACEESVLAKDSAAKVKITKLQLDGLNIINKVSSNPSGGLLGHSWGNADVAFAQGKDADNYSLSAGNATVTADSASQFGGLVYAASGRWTISDYSIDLSQAKLSATGASKFGMLVCRSGKDLTVGNFDKLSGLYLLDAAPWATAYKVNEAQDALGVKNNAAFDEWVADAVREGSKVTDTGYNGVVSLHTEADYLNMSGNSNDRNSYVNRTEIGRSKQTNERCRYYYNLDRALGKIEKGKSSWLSSPEELLVWSACRYAAPNVRDYIANSSDYPNLTATGSKHIGVSSGATAIDLGGYSYYPVDSDSADMTVINVTITFHYDAIKSEEEGNKKNNDTSQHMNMHAGLFKNFNSGSGGDRTLSVSSVTLAGAVGLHLEPMPNGTYEKTSGALVCRSMNGNSTGKKIAKIDIKGLTLNGLRVANIEENESYAPLLAAEMRTFVGLNIENVSIAEGSYGKQGSYSLAGTSMFGNLGNSSADMVSATFNTIAVPSGLGTGNSIFTRASLLESFAYGEGKTGTGVYTFTKADREGDKVTYGKEIDSKSGEYENLQLWYYDDDLHGTDNGLVEDKAGHKASKTDDQFAQAYLPYVKQGKKDNIYHEIKVNQRIPSLKTGCGTYGDPYAVKNAEELNAISSYIRDPNSAMEGWEITIAIDQEALCTRRSDGKKDNEATYVYSKATGRWSPTAEGQAKATLDNATMHSYLQSAYYSIEPNDDGDIVVSSIELDGDAFGGFGNETNPFRGVIVGNLKKDKQGKSVPTTLVVKKGNKSLQGLVPYSYGSVVKDVTIEYDGESKASATNNVDYKGLNDNKVPNAFFGGVIGCILGGDNILSGVKVESANSFDVKGVSQSNDAHKVPIGGYVGVVAGGGVIFRDMGKQGESWHSDGASLYDNPYVGRVVDGYAFSEGCVIDNGNTQDKANGNTLATSSYKVVKLDIAEKTSATWSSVETTGMDSSKYRNSDNPSNYAPVTTVHSAQGLLVLSAIINSGAGAGPSATTWAWYGAFKGSRAYQGYYDNSNSRYKFGNIYYGKVRNSDYSTVGVGQNPDDAYKTSVADDLWAPGNRENGGALDRKDGDVVNSPYLVAAYAKDWQTGYVCAADLNGMVLAFDENETYDLTSYGSGFLGLAGRYYTNACVSDDFTTDRDRIVPRLACIDGNGATIKVTNTFKEYADDDFKVQAVGGLFGFVEFTNDTRVSGSVTANAGSVVSDLSFADSTVSLQRLNADGTKSDTAGDGKLGVGTLAGATANWDGLADSGKYTNVSLSSCTVKSPDMAGGLYGASGWNRRSTSDSYSVMIADGEGDGEGISPVKLYDCSFDKMTVTGSSRVGGFVGGIGGKGKTGGEGSVAGVWTTGSEGAKVGENSTITATGTNSTAGGVFGLAWSKVKANVETDGVTSSGRKSELSDVMVFNSGGGQWQGNNLTNIGTGGFVGNPKAGCDIRNLAVGFTESNGPTIGAPSGSSQKLKGVGGVIGLIDEGSTAIVQSTGVEHANLAMSDNGDSGGGIVGCLRQGKSLECDDIKVDGISLNNQWCGGVVGSIHTSGTNVTVTNSSVRNVTFEKNNVGGISGDGRGGFVLANVLLSKNTYSTESSNNGILLGSTSKNDVTKLYAAGIDVVPADSKSTSDMPKMFGANSESVRQEVNGKSYIAFADYTDSLGEVSGTDLYNDDNNGDGSMDTVKSVSPYVTTNPVSDKPLVKGSEGGENKKLFGDGVAIKTAAGIQANAGKLVPNTYTYTNIGGTGNDGSYSNENSYNASNAASTYNDNNQSSPLDSGSNFDVLLVSGNDTETVKNYLNLVTNGGFSDAVRLNGNNGVHVSAKTELFKWDSAAGAFVRQDDSATLSVVNDGTSSMSFRASTRWDNEKQQFSLLTVTFSEGGQKYKVQVPVIVKRMLEINFTATYDYGTNFNADSYANRGANDHVLSNFGESMAGYLTWAYNRSGSQADTIDYGWDSHLASGGSMKPLGKTIDFGGNSGAMPVGTQLTLIDKANNDKEYYYTVEGEACTSVPLTAFKSASDDSSYEEPWFSETMGVTAKQDSSGAWVPCAAEDRDAGVKIGSSYYKPAGQADSPSDRWTLEVAKNAETGKEISPEENFYLVINVPSSGSQQKAIDGYTGSSVTTTDVNKSVHPVLRSSNENDDRLNTASTYSVYSSYKQQLTDNVSSSFVEMATTKHDDSALYSIPLSVTDVITFDPAQSYNQNDRLFYQLNSSLGQYNESGSLLSAGGWPMGITGTAKFYVSIGETYYKWNGSAWVEAKAWTPAVEAPRDWSSNAGEMRLPLGVDLSTLRKTASDQAKAAGDTQASITIRTEIDSVELQELACQAGIAAGHMETGASAPSAYTKMQFRSNLATSANGLNTTSMTANVAGNVGYYREHNGNSTIELSASMQSQLGINVNDLALANGTIAAYGTYDLSDLINADDLIKEAASVRYTLKLQKRTGTDGSYEDVPVPIGNQFVMKDSPLGTGTQVGDQLVFVDSKARDAFTTQKSNKVFQFPFVVKVNTDVEDNNFTYANYRLVLSAELLDASGNVIDTPVNKALNSGYPNSDYITYTLSKINTNGIAHS